MNIHALWCHPRSVSTAFERIMRERGDLDVLHEPFLYDYYLTQTGQLFPDFEPQEGHPTTFADIRKMILERSEKQTVFIKDMAFYVLNTLPSDGGFMRQMSHCFLIRDPAESIVSYYHRDPDFSLVEVGVEAQFRLYQVLVAEGISPFVVTSDNLRNEPFETIARYWKFVGLPYVADAFAWDTSVPEGWQAVKGWHARTLRSGAIQKPDTNRDSRAELEALGERFVEYDRYHRPFYEALKDISEHQK